MTKAIVWRICTDIGKNTVIIISPAKGEEIQKSNIYRNFGMPNPEEGKTLRLMKRRKIQ